MESLKPPSTSKWFVQQVLMAQIALRIVPVTVAILPAAASGSVAQGTPMRAILSYSHRCAHVTESILIFCARRLPITAMESTVGKGFVWMTSIPFAASVILDIREYDAWISSQIILPLALR